jgi:cyclic peptide transporter
MISDILRKSRNAFLLISAISALAGASNIWLLALVNRQARALSPALGDMATFGLVLALMLGVSFLSQTLLSRLSARTFFHLREMLAAGINSLSVRQIDRLGAHRLYTALTRDVPAVHDFVAVLPTYVFNFTVALACLVYLSTISLRLLGVFLFFLAIALVVAKFAINDRGERKFAQRRRVEDDLFKCYKAIIEGNKELKLNADRAATFLNEDLRHHAVRYREATLSAEFFWNLSSNWSLGMIFIGVGAMLFAAGHIGVSDRAVVTAFVLVIFYMVNPLTLLMNSFRTIHSARVSMARLRELELDHAPSAVPAVAALEPFESLTVEQAEFAYEGNGEEPGFHVGPFDLHIERGEIVYIVGGNGSGKTTAAKIVMGLYPLSGGRLRVNGKPVQDQQAYFQRFSAVMQDYHLFDTVAPKHGAPIGDEQVAALIAQLRLADKVQVSGGRLSTTDLSYGQRKRLALLVAYCDNSDVYVFDEWAADQDPEFREFFYKQFLPDMKRKGKTLLVVSHDDRYFHLADKIVKFERGQIAPAAQGADEPAPVPQVVAA